MLRKRLWWRDGHESSPSHDAVTRSETLSPDWQPTHQVLAGDEDELLAGAYDLHLHAAPDQRPRKQDAVDLIRSMSDAGMSGAVLKDHYLPTVGRVHVLNRLFPELRLFSTCVLNNVVGGLNPAFVEAALGSGVHWVFMPTVSSAHFRHYDGVPKSPTDAREHIDLRGPEGDLRPQVHEILDLLVGRDVVLASGHVSPEESFLLLSEANRRGIERRVVTHATIDFIQMPVSMQRALAADGTFIEQVYGCCYYRDRGMPLERLWSEMREVGLEHCYLATDFGQPQNPPAVEGWRSAIGGLRALGASVDDVRQLISLSPMALLDGLPRFGGVPDGWVPET